MKGRPDLLPKILRREHNSGSQDTQTSKDSNTLTREVKKSPEFTVETNFNIINQNDSLSATISTPGTDNEFDILSNKSLNQTNEVFSFDDISPTKEEDVNKKNIIRTEALNTTNLEDYFSDKNSDFSTIDVLKFKDLKPITPDINLNFSPNLSTVTNLFTDPPPQQQQQQQQERTQSVEEMLSDNLKFINSLSSPLTEQMLPHHLLNSPITTDHLLLSNHTSVLNIPNTNLPLASHISHIPLLATSQSTQYQQINTSSILANQNLLGGSSMYNNMLDELFVFPNATLPPTMASALENTFSTQDFHFFNQQASSPSNAKLSSQVYSQNTEPIQQQQLQKSKYTNSFNQNLNKF
ncbi:hypothetical protein HK099_002763 [Clydaea vesicula]|uniref:Uncharacterized protein n=1 Tax=Clydaea vesicula TaxID=447962 RepID=A0AAD5XWG5_9FUNG|nr:hypothetical protein HK099_002763 [Clydaea vesicula]